MSVPSLHKKGMKKAGTFVFILISDSRSKESADSPDKTTPLVTSLLEKNGHQLLMVTTVPDEINPIQAEIRNVISKHQPQFVVTSGGTGVTARDVTPEAARGIFTREIPGFGEIFRMLSYKEIGASALFSRAIAGIIGTTTIFCLPGSPNAVKMALEQLILPEVPHFHKMIPQL
ncbi:MAG: MogA/MoaB family molybdenum cofactor biosynthesis protein [Candidatus Ranarchaeia archaeon]|jgi:molybdenum cofactor biosynthesis protein B